MGQGRTSQDGGHDVEPPAAGTLLWRLMLKLQLFGWLQHLPNAPAALLTLVLAGIGWLIAVWPVAPFWFPIALGCVPLALRVFDLLTVKVGLHPAEPVPPRRDDVDASELMLPRHSCRSFPARELSAADRAELMACVRRHTQPDQQIGGAPIRLEYVAAALTAWSVVGAHELFVVVGPRECDRLAIIDVGRSLEKVVLHATRMGLGTCRIGPGADQKSIVLHLGDRFDPERDHVVSVCAVEYASRYQTLALRLMHVARLRPCFEACRWSPSSHDSQTTPCAAVVTPRPFGRPLERFDVSSATKSSYYAPVARGIWCANWETGCDALGVGGHVAAIPPADGAAGYPSGEVIGIFHTPLPDPPRVR